MSKTAVQDRVHRRTLWLIERYGEKAAYDAFLKAVWKKARELNLALTDKRGCASRDLHNLRLDLSHKYAYAVTPFEENCLANDGIDELWTLVTGTGATQFDNSNAYIGVGDDNTAAAAAQTDLQAVTNKLRVAMEASYPTYGSSQKATWRSSFGGSDANWHWEEFAVFNASSGGIMLNRKVSDQGTKTAGQTWVVTLEITLS